MNAANCQYRVMTAIVVEPISIEEHTCRIDLFKNPQRKEMKCEC